MRDPLAFVIFLSMLHNDEYSDGCYISKLEGSSSLFSSIICDFDSPLLPLDFLIRSLLSESVFDVGNCSVMPLARALASSGTLLSGTCPGLLPGTLAFLDGAGLSLLSS